MSGITYLVILSNILDSSELFIDRDYDWII